MMKVTGKCVVFGLMAAALAISAKPAWTFEVDVSEAPTDDLALTLSAIQGAQQSLLLNIYELSSSDIADALIARIQAGVHVEIIEEGQPVGGLSAASRGLESQIVAAMQAASGADDHFFEMRSQPGHTRRFKFDHAKYAVIDGERLLIGSENYSPTGNAQPGTKGNRGWEVLIHDAGTAQEFQQVFASDSQLSYGDLTDLVGSGGFAPNDFKAGHHPRPTPTPTPTADPAPTPSSGVPVVSQPGTVQRLDASTAQRVTSPDTSLSGLLALVNSATSSLDIEQMTFDSAWGGGGQTSPLVDAVLAAARRGVKVRVLLNDESVFDHPGHPAKHKNQPTADALNQAAQSENLALAARIANLQAMGVTYIHNKGVLVDADRTLISSINWDENSVEHNREAAVVLTSAAVHDHYEALFESDWAKSATGPSSNGGFDPGPAFLLPREQSLDCPDALRLKAQIGDLVAGDADDGFAALSGATISDTFGRVVGVQGCLLADAAAASGHETAKARFVEIRRRANGAVLVALEGYTPAGKLYSVRATVPAGTGIEGDLQASVYDGSGPGRPKLGSATLEIVTAQGN